MITRKKPTFEKPSLTTITLREKGKKVVLYSITESVESIMEKLGAEKGEMASPPAPKKRRGRRPKAEQPTPAVPA